MIGSSPVAVTGARGRLGRALVKELTSRGFDPIPWSRPDYDLDDPAAASRLVPRDRPGIVIHAAAWTDVDGCAHDPGMAMRRNADAVGELAVACAATRTRLVLVSTNEVFDGERTDGKGYRETDPPNPINSYGASKFAGEQQAADAFARSGRADDLLITRTAWLFGPPGDDFPAKILAAADRLPAAEPLRVVTDEVGSPTYSADLANAMARLLLLDPPAGTYHLVNAGHASRLDLAGRVLARCRPQRATVAISRTQFVRASRPPAWAVLENTRAAALGVTLRPWQAAVDDYVPALSSA